MIGIKEIKACILETDPTKLEMHLIRISFFELSKDLLHFLDGNVTIDVR